MNFPLLKAHKSFNNFVLLIVIVFNTQIAVTIQPCPTNKIAPHRRIGSWSSVKPRTFGSVLELFHDDDLYPNTPTYAGSELQESAQEDDPDDCGDIEDYDETDVSSATQSQRLQGYHEQKFFLQHFFTKPPRTTIPHPPRPQTRPPTGGYFGTNHYRPPLSDDPSDALKPVHEQGHEPQSTYRPGVVGGPSGHVVGVHVKPHKYHPQTQASSQNPPTNDQHKYRPAIAGPIKPNRYYPHTQSTLQDSPTDDQHKYRPAIAGPIKPNRYYPHTQSSLQYSPTDDQHKYRPSIGGINPNRYPPYTLAPSQNSPTNNPQNYQPHYTTRRPRQYSGSIVGSFFDLLF